MFSDALSITSNSAPETYGNLVLRSHRFFVLQRLAESSHENNTTPRSKSRIGPAIVGCPLHNLFDRPDSVHSTQETVKK